MLTWKKKLNCDNLVLQGRLTLTSREPTADKVPSLAQSFQLPASCLCGRESLMSESPMPYSFGVSGCLHKTAQDCLPRDAFNNTGLKKMPPLIIPFPLNTKAKVAELLGANDLLVLLSRWCIYTNPGKNKRLKWIK